MEKEDIEISKLLINDLFLEYVFAYSESSCDLHLPESLCSLANRESVNAARDIILSRNQDAVSLSNQEFSQLKEKIIETMLSSTSYKLP